MNRQIGIVTTLLFIACIGHAYAESGLLLIAHGSPAEDWNKPIRDLGDKVREAALVTGHFKAVRTAFLEFAEPGVSAMVEELEAAGCERIIAVPLFIAPSGHSHFDIPAALGIYSSAGTRATLALEGTEAAKPKVPITLTETLSEGRLLREYALDQVKKLSSDPQEEALVLIAHGDADHGGINEAMMRQLAGYCCGHSGIDRVEWAFVEVGQSYAAEALPAFARAGKGKKRVIAVGLYVATTAENLHKRAMKGGSGHGVPVMDEGSLVLSKESIIENPGVADWVVATATACLNP